MKQDEKIARLRLIRSNNIGPVTSFLLISRYGSAIEAIRALPELTKRSRNRAKLAPLKSAEKEMRDVEDMGGQIIIRGEEGYPAAFTAYDDAPAVITVLGHTSLLHRPLVAIVGSRNASVNACNFASRLAGDLGAKGFIIVSGMARGIDRHAHEGGLDRGTIAVLAGGVDQIYPRENEDIYQHMVAGGAIISEMPLGMQAMARHFPIRNRLIASMATATIVIEAGLRSGSLITAREATERGREVMAVPGSPLDPRARGGNSLIRNGATLVQDAEDVIAAIRQPELDEPGRRRWLAGPSVNEPVEEDIIPEAKEILLEMLGYETTEVDELIRQCHFSPAVIIVALLELELAGEVTRHFGNRVSRRYNDE